MDVVCFSQQQKLPVVTLLLSSLCFNTHGHLLGEATLSACTIIPLDAAPAAEEEAGWTMQAGAAQLYCTYCDAAVLNNNNNN